MIAMHGRMDRGYGRRDGLASVEFSWNGEDEGDERSGRGWAALEPTASYEAACLSTLDS